MELMLTILSTFGCNGILLFFIKRYFSKIDKERARKLDVEQEFFSKLKVSLETIRLLAYSRLSEELDAAIRKGYATPVERRYIDSLYQNYSEHGWNGDMKERLRIYYALPMSPPED